LYHEMVHASRDMRGVTFFGPGVNRDYENREEYLAVALTNVYLSEKGQRYFRADHGFPPRVLIDPEKWLDNGQWANLPPEQLIEDFRIRQPTFYDALAKVEAWFNPVKQHKERSRG